MPTLKGDQPRAFARVITRIGDSRLPFLPAFDSTDARTNLGASVSETLHGEVVRILDGLKKLGTEAKGPRESSLKRRLDDLDDLTHRASAARIILDDYADGIDKAVGHARKHVLSMMELPDLIDTEEVDGQLAD